MGRIKSKLIKRTGKNLMDDEKFNGNFDENKKVLGGLMPSKKIRNQVAGYITRKKKVTGIKASRDASDPKSKV